MKMYLDTSSDTCVLRLDDKEYRWVAGHELAEGLLAFLRDRITEQSQASPSPVPNQPSSASVPSHPERDRASAQSTADPFHQLTEITFYSGPGSFTGLRIGAAVVNTLAHELGIPLYNHRGEPVPIIIPDYGRPARITPQKK